MSNVTELCGGIGSNKSSLCSSPVLRLSSQEIPVPYSPYTAIVRDPSIHSTMIVPGYRRETREKYQQWTEELLQGSAHKTEILSDKSC